MLSHPDPTVAHVLSTWAPRMVVNGVDYNDLVSTSARIKTWADWPREWMVTAAAHEQRAREAEARHATASATEAYLLASAAYHFACNNSPHDQATYVPAARKRVECYAKAAPHLDPPAERHEVPFNGIRLPGYLRVPRGASRPPVVVIVSGLESVKEEHRTFEDGLLRRGLATFTFDGPGQGEVWFEMGLIVDFERATSTVIDDLERVRAVDAGRLGIFGPSMGGYLAPRSAACDDRIKACAISGGSYDRSRLLKRLDDPFDFARWSHIWKVYDKAKLRDLTLQSTLEGLAPKIGCPLLIIHGTEDFVPLEQAKQLYAEAGGPKELVIVAGGNHVCNNMPFVYRPLVGDFLVRTLA